MSSYSASFEHLAVAGLAEGSHVGFGTWSYVPKTGLVSISSSARHILGLPPDVPFTRSVLTSLLSHKDAMSVCRALFDAARHGGAINIQAPVRIMGREDRWVRLRGGVMLPDSGMTAVNGIILDIDEEKKLEVALRLREEHLRSILDTVPDGMIVIDDRGIIQFFSSTAEKMFGLSSEAAIGASINMLMPEQDARQHNSHIQRYADTGERHIIGTGRVLIGKRQDGATFPMYISVGEVQSGGRRYFTGFVRDLTEQHQTQARLQKLQAELVHISRLSAMGEMASALAHELNQPLAAISNYMKGSYRLLESMHDPNALKIAAALDRAAEQAMRAGQIITRLRNFVSRGETERKPENILRLVEEACGLGLVGAREQGVSIQLDLDPACGEIVGDRVQIQQVLVNLFRNALEAMQASKLKHLTISSRPTEGNMILISVSDTGHGFAEGTKPVLFQPFFTTKQTGMGVGLSISRTIIEAHGGQMWADASPSGGAVFRFSLPARAAQEAVPPSGERR